ncbi:hypothetical protein [Nonomuraea endophytica]|uniref:Ig-like domain-containing protein n=1 Tax=Nonomuraea endophytica TaxID=714136 RepID=A0A7W8A7F3_9ACTN|nr:hypothetical protein [Nonomuraea endophytica]MBB5080449.1 hypothetical protein [Nonomuraea endophytica]
MVGWCIAVLGAAMLAAPSTQAAGGYICVTGEFSQGRVSAENCAGNGLRDVTVIIWYGDAGTYTCRNATFYPLASHLEATGCAV